MNIPTPYGGTPMFDRDLAAGRILAGMPRACDCAPYLARTPSHYDPPGYYRELLRIHEAVRAGHFFQAIAHRAQVAELRRFLRRLETDRPFRAFHEGKSVPLPGFDHRRFERRLGRFAGLVSRADRVPVMEATAPGLRSR